MKSVRLSFFGVIENWCSDLGGNLFFYWPFVQCWRPILPSDCPPFSSGSSSLTNPTATSNAYPPSSLSTRPPTTSIHVRPPSSESFSNPSRSTYSMESFSSPSDVHLYLRTPLYHETESDFRPRRLVPPLKSLRYGVGKHWAYPDSIYSAILDRCHSKKIYYSRPGSSETLAAYCHRGISSDAWTMTFGPSSSRPDDEGTFFCGSLGPLLPGLTSLSPDIFDTKRGVSDSWSARHEARRKASVFWGTSIADLLGTPVRCAGVQLPRVDALFQDVFRVSFDEQSPPVLHARCGAFLWRFSGLLFQTQCVSCLPTRTRAETCWIWRGFRAMTFAWIPLMAGHWIFLSQKQMFVTKGIDEFENLLI